MASTVCAFCNARSHMTPMWAETIEGTATVQGHTMRTNLMQGIGKCDNCGRTSMGVTSSPVIQYDKSVRDFAATPDSHFSWYPRIGEAPEFEDVPEQIAQAASEAHAAWSINARMAAILIARTVIEATAKEKGITSGMLVAKIDAMASQSTIRDSTRDAAHEIRHLGNDMAHGDISDLPEDDDVTDVLTLMDEVLNEVFQGPAKTARLKARRSSTTSP